MIFVIFTILKCRVRSIQLEAKVSVAGDQSVGQNP
jgi:hypothetical protein